MQFLWLFLLLGSVLAAPVNTLSGTVSSSGGSSSNGSVNNDITPVLPSVDDFYLLPSDFDKYKVGDIMKIRKTPHPLRSVWAELNVSASWQALVKTTANDGKNTTWMVTTIIEPYNANPKKLIQYHIAIDSLSPDCQTSYAIQRGGLAATISSQAEMLFIQVLLNKGYYVVSPDYEASSSAFTPAHQAAYASLDSIRAALSSGKTTGIDLGASVVTWGYSGGSLPTSWGAALQPSYAPDLKNNLKGAAFGGTLANLTAAALKIDDSIFSGLLVGAVGGLAKTYPIVDKLIHDQLSPSGMKEFEKTYDLCMVPGLVEYLLAPIFNGEGHMAKDGMKVFENPDLQKVLAENTLAGEQKPPIPQVPIFMYHGMFDEILPFDESQRVYDTWCENGIGLFEFAADIAAEHLIGILSGAGPAYKFIDERLSGVAPIKGCSKLTRLSNFMYPNVTTLLWDVGSVAWDSFRGDPIGPKSKSN